MNQIIEWFKTSIPGIIILGALGSILAIILLKFARWVFNKFIGSAYTRLVFPLFLKPYIFHMSLTRRLLKSEDKTKLLVYAGWKLGNFAITTALFFVMVGINILHFTISGIRLTTSTFILVTFTFLVLFMWLTDVMGGLAVHNVLLDDDYKSEKAKIDKLTKEIISPNKKTD